MRNDIFNDEGLIDLEIWNILGEGINGCLLACDDLDDNDPPKILLDRIQYRIILLKRVYDALRLVEEYIYNTKEVE